MKRIETHSSRQRSSGPPHGQTRAIGPLPGIHLRNDNRPEVKLLAAIEEAGVLRRQDLFVSEVSFGFLEPAARPVSRTGRFAA